MLCLLLSGSMMFGSFSTPIYAEDEEIQSETVAEEQVTDTQTESSQEQENVSETDDTNVADTEADAVESEGTETADDNAAAPLITLYNVTKPSATYKTAQVTAVKLKENEGGSVWGTGLITGSGDFDSVSWNRTTGENKGYDSANDNDIIRSFDSIEYHVSSTINLDTASHILVYEVTLPDDDELTLDEGKMNAIKPIDCRSNDDGKTKTYICQYNLKEDFSGGELTENVVIKVGNKHQDDTIEPVIRAYLDDSTDKAITVANMRSVTVTTAPMYNIVLKKRNNETLTVAPYNFNQASNSNQNRYHYKDNANGYDDYKVNGYRCTYGFALEVRKNSGGIKGVEIPNASEDFTFDIDLSNATLQPADSKKNPIDLIKNGFGPLLFYVGPNEPGGGTVTELPYTSESTDPKLAGKGCYNSGNINVTQDRTTLHVKIKDFAIDASKYPQTSGDTSDKAISFWEDINKIREGIFSAYQFQVVYPYTNEKGENLQEKLGDGTINVRAEVKNISAVSDTGTTVTSETTLEDNYQTNSWSVASGNKRSQLIFYSKKDKIQEGYVPTQIWKDGDVAAVGAQDLAFTVGYHQNNASDASNKADFPVAIEQFVLFDRSAVTDVRFNEWKQLETNDNGYECMVKYAVRKTGRMDNDSMRTAELSDFDFYDEPQENCDGVLVKYRGMNLNSEATEMNLYAQFNAKVSSNNNVARNVYMITAFTNIWTVSDFKDKILSDMNKSSLNDVTRKNLSGWGIKQNINELGLVNGQAPKLPKLDNRRDYTVPTYINGAYSVGDKHNYSVNWADALYIVPYTTTVAKTVAQIDENGNPMQLYNIGLGQKYVDYKISGSIKYETDVNPNEGDTTTVYLEDTIPAGLNYIEGSAYWGGTYTSNYPKKGSVEGGTPVTPIVTTNDKGLKVLKWEIPNVPLQNGALPTLYYSCKIDKDVAANTSLKNTVTIQTTEDKRTISAEAYNTSDATISVTKSNEFYIVKRGGASLELNDKSYYELVAANTSSADKRDLWMFDTMPYTNDGKSTKIDGNYIITSFTMDAEEVDHAEDMEIWYTSEKRYIGKTAKEIDPKEVTESNGWHKAEASGHESDTITFTGDGFIGGWPTVIAYKDANLERNTSAIFRIEYEAIAAAENDDFVNEWSTMANGEKLWSRTETDIYDRTIEGTVWFDKDKDGIIDDDEKKLEGVKVTLYVEKNGKYEPYEAYTETLDGKEQKSPSTILTDKNGHYKFRGLPEGKYQIRFESSDGTPLGNYDVTTANAISDTTKTSKVTKDNVVKDTDDKFTSGTITDITMPSLDVMVKSGDKTYNLPDQNLGLIIPTRSISITKNWDDNNDQDGKRPNEIKVNLYADGKLVEGKTLTIAPDSEGNWTGSFKYLPKYDEDNIQHEIVYTVKEVGVDGYENEITGDIANGYVITNKHTPETTSVSISKTWDDKDNQDGKRPESITIRLLANGVEKDVKTVTAADNWTWTFDNLPKYEAGQEINYTITEDAVTGYTTSIEHKTSADGNSAAGTEHYDVTNTYNPGKVSISVTKSWNDSNDQDGIRPEKITIKLYADGKDTGKTLELTAATNWSGSFTGLDEYKAGNKIEYTVEEEEVNGYTSAVSGDAATGYVITNTHTPEIPDEPDKPDTPDVPDTPDTPDVPDTPDTPDTPDVPDTPDTPDTPATPDVPDTPDTPDTPDVPDTPDIPDVPDTPTQPENPTTPSEPQTPATPTAPKTQEPQKVSEVKKTAKTGDSNNPALWIVLFFAPLGILAERLRKKHNK